MIEQFMFLALGAFSAGLISIAILPAFWRRAERLVRRQLERQLPLSPREIAAERDQLRAEFAVRQRKLEQSIAETLGRRADDQREIGLKLLAVSHAHEQVSEREAEITRLNGDLAERNATIEAVRADLARSESAHGETQATLTAETRTREGLATELTALTALSNQRQQDIEVLTTQLDTERAALDAQTRITHETETRLIDQIRLHKDLQSAFVALTDRADQRRLEISNLGLQIESLNQQLLEEKQARQELRQTLQSRILELNALQRDLVDANNRTLKVEAQLTAAQELATRRQQAIDAKNETLQAKSSLISDFSQQSAIFRAELKAESDARLRAEQDAHEAAKRVAELEQSIQRITQDSKEMARDLSKTIDTLRLNEDRRRVQKVEPRAQPRAGRQLLPRPDAEMSIEPKSLELAGSIPEADIIDLSPSK